MKFSKPQKIKDIAAIIGAEIVGDDNLLITGINEINVVQEGDIVFVDHPKYYNKVLNSKGTVIIINKQVDCPAGKALMVCEDPFGAFNRITSQFSARSFSQKPISDSAVIGKNTRIMPNCFVGDHVKITILCIDSLKFLEHFAFDKSIELRPVFISYKKYRYLRDFFGLNKSEYIEKLIDGSKSTRKKDVCFSGKGKHCFSAKKMMKKHFVLKIDI